MFGLLNMGGAADSLKPTLQFIRPYKKQILIASIALLITAAVTLSLGQGLRLIIDQGFTANSQALLNKATLIFFGLVVLLAIGTYVRHYLVSWIGERVVADIRKAVFNHLIDLHPSFYEENHSGEIQSRITADTTLIQSVIGSSVSIALRNLLMFIGGIVFLMVTNVKLAGIVLLSVPLVVIPIKYFGRRVRSLSRNAQDKLADVGSYVGEALSQIKTVQAYNHQEVDKLAFEGVTERTFNVAKKRIQQRSMLIAVVILFVLGSVGLMLWVGGRDVMSGEISGGELAAFVFYALIVGSSVGSISEVVGELLRAAGANERLMELLHAENQIVSPENAKASTMRCKGQIRLENVTFAYASRQEIPALRSISLEIEAGKTLALVGPSGAGKTTLMDLLLRFYDVQEGVIYLDGVDITTLELDVLRHQMALVSQSPALFRGTVRENILYGKPSASEDELMVAARAAYVMEFIDRLPHGFDTVLGEGGLKLSGGQRQRIAIARALLKDPAVLLLDEATSALDAESEYMVQMALAELLKNRTSIVIAHRLATVVNADQIALLDKGEVLAAGSHPELIAKSDLYARLAELQFKTLEIEPS